VSRDARRTGTLNGSALHFHKSHQHQNANFRNRRTHRDSHSVFHELLKERSEAPLRVVAELVGLLPLGPPGAIEDMCVPDRLGVWRVELLAVADDQIKVGEEGRVVRVGALLDAIRQRLEVHRVFDLVVIGRQWTDRLDRILEEEGFADRADLAEHGAGLGDIDRGIRIHPLGRVRRPRRIEHGRAMRYGKGRGHSCDRNGLLCISKVEVVGLGVIRLLLVRLFALLLLRGASRSRAFVAVG
jgi:hypothetical protein